MRYTVKKRYKIPPFMMALAILIGLAFYLLWFMELHLKPTLLAIAEARATLIATQSINHVINEKVNKDIDPQSLMNVKLDNQGRVALIQPNTIEFNKLAADMTIKVQDALEKLAEEKISIPIGQVLGSQFLASKGPQVTVTIIPVGTVQVKVIDKFEQAGINQTKHMVYLIVTTKVKIVVPLVSKSVSVDTQVPVAEYVVVGEVPETYVQFPSSLLNEAEKN